MTTRQNDPVSPLEGFLGNLPQNNMSARMKAAAAYHNKTLLFTDNFDMTGQDIPCMRVKDGIGQPRYK